jgi:hypothetical protein
MRTLGGTPIKWETLGELERMDIIELDEPLDGLERVSLDIGGRSKVARLRMVCHWERSDKRKLELIFFF